MPRAAEAPVLYVHGVEPDEPEQAIEANTSKQVSNFRWLPRGGRRGCLGNEYRVWVSARTAAMVGPNKEANTEDEL